MVHVETQKIRNKEQSPRVAGLRQELRRKIAAHASNAGAHATAILGLTLYRRTAPSPCYPAMYEPSLNVFVQGRKRIALAGATYLCDESTFVLSSIDVPIVSQIVAASEDVPLLSLLLKLEMAVVREILSQAFLGCFCREVGYLATVADMRNFFAIISVSTRRSEIAYYREEMGTS